MNYLTLLKMADEAIAADPKAAVDSVGDRMYLSMTEPEKHNGYRVRLFRKRGPYAVILNGARGRLTVYVSARRVRDYLNGLVVKSRTSNE